MQDNTPHYNTIYDGTMQGNILRSSTKQDCTTLYHTMHAQSNITQTEIRQTKTS